MSSVLYTNKQEIVESIIQDDDKVVLDFSAPAWCQPCMRFAPHFERAASEAPEITFIAVDVDNAPWAGLDYNIVGVPTVKLYEHGTFVRDVAAPQGALPFLRDIRS